MSSIETTAGRSSSGWSLVLLADDLHLFVDARVAQIGLEEEAVELRLRERERALLLDRVLGGEQQEGVGQRAA